MISWSGPRSSEILCRMASRQPTLDGQAMVTSAATTSHTRSTRSSDTTQTTRSPDGGPTSTRRWPPPNYRLTATGFDSKGRSSGRRATAIRSTTKLADSMRFSICQGIRLTQTGVALVNPESLLPSLRSSKTEGQANFVNPGLFLYNLGLDADLTPKLKGIVNLNYLQFHHTETLEGLLFQPGIRRSIGLDYGAGVVYRPFLNENTIVAGGISSLIPGVGFKDIFTSNCSGLGCGTKGKVLYSAF